jgi:hypothetical protein
MGLFPGAGFVVTTRPGALDVTGRSGITGIVQLQEFASGPLWGLWRLTGLMRLRLFGTNNRQIANLHTIHTLCADHRHMPWFCLSRTSFSYLVRGV